MNNGYIQLYSGRMFNPLWPTPDSFTVEDLVQGWLGQHRFYNFIKTDYRVLQHELIMARWFLKRGMITEARYASIHEGSEGLGLGDMPSPIKYLPEMEGYRLLCKTVDVAVFRKMGLFAPPPPAVKELDIRIQAAEAKVLLRNVPDWALEVDTSDLVIKPYKNPTYGKTAYLKLFKELFPSINIYE